MIPFDYITEWRSQAPWVQDAQVEQDLILSRAVVEVFQNPVVSRALAFRGGTALYKLHLHPPARYSDDIDLVQLSPEPIGHVIDSIRSDLDPWLGTPKRMLKTDSVSLIYRMNSEGQPSLPMRLKIEINSREHLTVLGVEEREFAVQSRWFNATAAVKTFQLEELLGTKLRALYQRKKGRDLFDLFAADRLAAVSTEIVVECFLRYMEHQGLSVSRALMEMNLDEKLSDERFLMDIGSLIAPDFTWDAAEAAEYVLQELIALLPGDPWKGHV
ncbi:MAG: nucleotidyl transferase AbiEii/AbiGii toxin family protein [Candidatus Latescibacteria bacterium]|nr:nucleotidyl transferase AbiEii/AbiGii toxin family protein [Candidatus Latescibacterota bacterium]